MFNCVSCLVILVSVVYLSPGVSGREYKRVCYYTNWSQYRPGAGKYTPDNIDPKLCTHLIYAFAVVRNSEIHKYEWNDEEMYKKFNGLKSDYPNLKTLIAVGGWNAGSKEFSLMASTQTNRAKFIQSVLAFLRLHGFDGLDIDWEYPAKRGGTPADKQNLVYLVQELKQAFEKESFLLTSAVPAGRPNIDDGYDVKTLLQHMDFINLMSYDLHGSWEKVTGENSPLSARSGEFGQQRELNMKWAAEYWVSKGAPREKLVIGIATYGRSFTLANPSVNGVGAPASGPGKAGMFTRSAGFLAYYEICKLEETGQGVTHWENEQKVPYFTVDKLWVGYDNQRSVTEKVKWLMQEGYGGAMVWSLDLDDFAQMCKSSTVRYPLLTTIYSLLTSRPLPPKPETTKSKQTTTERTKTTTRTTKTTTSSHSGFSCTHRPDGFYADVKDCRRFYRCVNGRTYHYICPVGLYFNPKIQQCDWPRNVDCKME